VPPDGGADTVDEFEAAVRGEPRPGRVVHVQLDLQTLVYVGLVIVVAMAVGGLFQEAPATITRLAIALLFALALDPLVVAAQRRFRLRRRAAVAAVGSVFALAVFALVLVIGPATVSEAREFGEQLPETVQELYDLPIIGDRLREAEAAERITQWLQEIPAQIDTDDIVSLADDLVGGMAATIMVIVFVIAILLDGEVLVARFAHLVPPSRRPQLDRLGRLLYGTVGNYFAGSIFVAVLNGVAVLVVGLVLGVPLAPVAAVWAMVTNLIPQIGGFLGGSFFVLLAFSASPLTGLIALAFYLVYLQLENNVVQPAIVGQAVNLTPPTTMIAALIGGAAAGVPGAMAVTPLLGTAKAIYKSIRGEPVQVTKPHFRLPFRRHRPAEVATQEA
jgi:predicted PurR-regulated permease PerM